jgi:preprotein translocase subunit SecB
MKPSPLQLDRSSIGNVTVRIADRGVVSPEVEVEVVPTFARQNDNPLRWLVTVRISFGRSDDKPVPYQGQIECDGVFTIVDESLAEERQLRLIAVTAPSMLYAAAREVIASLTARSKNGVFLLPSVSFTDQTVIQSGSEHAPRQLENQTPAEPRPSSTSVRK